MRFFHKSAIFSKFQGQFHEINTENSPYIGCIARIIMKVYSSGMNQDVWRLSKLNSISMFYIRRYWQNYKNFNYRTSIVLPTKNSWPKSHRKRWKCRFSRRKFKILANFMQISTSRLDFYSKTFIFKAPGNAGRPAQTQNPEI